MVVRVGWRLGWEDSLGGRMVRIREWSGWEDGQGRRAELASQKQGGPRVPKEDLLDQHTYSHT